MLTRADLPDLMECVEQASSVHSVHRIQHAVLHACSDDNVKASVLFRCASKEASLTISKRSIFDFSRRHD